MTQILILLTMAMQLLIAAQQPNVPQSLRNTAISVANTAIQVANKAIAASSTPIVSIPVSEPKLGNVQIQSIPQPITPQPIIPTSKAKIEFQIGHITFSGNGKYELNTKTAILDQSIDKDKQDNQIELIIKIYDDRGKIFQDATALLKVEITTTDSSQNKLIFWSSDSGTSIPFHYQVKDLFKGLNTIMVSAYGIKNSYSFTVK